MNQRELIAEHGLGEKIEKLGDGRFAGHTVAKIEVCAYLAEEDEIILITFHSGPSLSLKAEWYNNQTAGISFKEHDHERRTTPETGRQGTGTQAAREATRLRGTSGHPPERAIMSYHATSMAQSNLPDFNVHGGPGIVTRMGWHVTDERGRTVAVACDRDFVERYRLLEGLAALCEDQNLRHYLRGELCGEDLESVLELFDALAIKERT